LIDPDNAFLVSTSPSRLGITVPTGLHDLWHGHRDPAKRFNGLRLLQEVQGDFVLHVRVNFRWQPGELLPDGTNFLAAGLLVWASEKQYLRHERNLYVKPEEPGRVYSWVPTIYDRDATRLSTWKSGMSNYFRERSTWMLLQRTGQKIHTWISHDGKGTRRRVLRSEGSPPLSPTHRAQHPQGEL